VQGVLELVKKIGPQRLMAMAMVSALLIAFFAYIIVRANQVPMAPLYSDLTIEDSSAVVRELETLGIAHEIRMEGAQILVPQDEVLRTRMRLAEKGMPTGGSIGYEIFDKQDALGTTSFVQNINHLRALEGELARTIRSIGRVQAARVHLVIPERQLFQRDRREPTASIVLKLRGQLDPSQTRAIQHLVAAAVEGLKPNRISIVDESGRMLASGNGADDDAGQMASTLQEKTVGFEQRLRNQVEEIIASVVGPGRARVQVAAELDFNRVTQTSDVFDPNGQVVRSTQSKEEASNSTNQERGVTVGNQVPNGGQEQGGASTRDASNNTEEIVNYEISKTTRTEVIEAGRVKRLSVAVLVDGVYTPGQNGEMSYAARPQEEIERIAALVRSAVGFDQARGDRVEVINLRFANAPNTLPIEAEPGLFDFTRADLMKFAEWGVLLILALLAFFLVVRPLLKKALGPSEEERAAQAAAEAAATGTNPDGTPAIGADTQPGEAITIGSLVIPGSLSPSKIEEAKAIGAMHASSIARVGELVKESPNEAALIIRTWINEAA
jgi:flagellar M-ring protein FliF